MNKIITIIGIIVIILLGVLIYKFQPRATLGGGSSVDTFAATTETQVSIPAGTIKNVVASNAKTKFVQIQNQAGGIVYCLLDGDTAASASVVTSSLNGIGFRLAPPISSTSTDSSMYEIRGYVGNINCTSLGAASTTVTIGS